PLQASGGPGIRVGDLAVAQRPDEVDHGQQIAGGEYAGAGGGEHVQCLELRRILPVAAGHADVAENELREEGQVEADEDEQRGELGPGFGIKAAGHLRPPEMQASEIPHEHAADHDIVEVGDNEVSVGNVDVDAEGGEEKPGQAAHGEKPDEAEGVKHGRGVRNRTLVEGRGPVEHVDRRGHADEESQERKDQGGVERDAGDEHVVGPDQESQDGNGDARQSDELVSEDALAREAGYEFVDHSHGRQDHDVDGRMRVEPEQVLKQERVSAESGIEDAEMEEALDGHEHDGDGDHRRAQDHDQAGGIVGPDEQRQAAPGEAGRAHAVNGNDEIESGEDG